MSEDFPKYPRAMLPKGIRKTADLALVGPLPPPLGGVSVHIQRLAMEAITHGYKVRIGDLRGTSPKKYPTGCDVSAWKTPLAALAGYCLLPRLMSPQGIIHFHASQLRTFLYFHTAWLSADLLKRVVVTFHAGDYLDQMRALDPLKRWMTVKAVRRVGRVIAVSNDMAQFFRHTVNRDVGIVDIPAFIPTFAGESGALPERVREFLGVRSPGATVVVSGYGTEVYGWHHIGRQIDRCPKEWRWIFCCYNKYDQPYYNTTVRSLAKRANVILCEDLSAPQFVAVLRASSVYVRPTSSDGDCVALREALGLGLHCVASDVAKRPEGVCTYTHEDEEALTRALLARPLVRTGEGASENYALKVLELYGDLIREGSANASGAHAVPSKVSRGRR